ncbi:polysaccharide biosynthesis tyrosine autokinase [Aureimonas jatrophae]|uniref:non-specific protein-tyrosine kinase n=1 Tax=Aureimonas jatrophae TaxID=1166073 RepID=A0A1H0NBU0_9HYPH|nr:polysaccharide biosynthesis tyrosine autokinase [Aureimonas jatrophae]MBB3951187.1 succinoglycan biosynthesis transport protein ExoP [Aureimonas jatrophae]SDO90219.1 succinoglycan biosynthesis transport protein ExoP [Aureimonas jatrophae]
MLHVTDQHFPHDDHATGGGSELGSALPSLEQIVGAIRRQMWVLAAGAVIGIAVGLAYVLTAVPLYTSSTDILIDKGQTQAVEGVEAATTGVFKDDAEMLSQVELLRSEHLARAVVDKLDLTNNPVFTAEAGMSPVAAVKAFVKQIITVFGGEEVEVAPDRETILQETAEALQDNIEVQRIGLTYALRLSYTSPDRQLSAQVARAYADVYIEDQLNAKFDATRRASGWLQDRIAELRSQAFDADLAVQKFRADNNLIAASGTLVSDQQLAEINSQLVTAQASTAEAKARYDQIEAIIASGRTDAVVNDALASTTINQLRERYLDASRREADIARRLGVDHIQAERLRGEMAEYERLIFQELKRIGDSYNNAYQVALTRQQSLEESLRQALTVTANAGSTQVRLRELERQAETFKSLYDNFLQRYQETVQQQSFPSINARVISPGSPAEFPSYPKKPLIMALFTMMGLAVAGGVAGFREYRDRFFRTGDQVRTELGVEFLGYTPELKAADMKNAPASGSLRPSHLFRTNSAALYVSKNPMSPFAETLRNAKVAADMSLTEKRSKVIGVVSCLPSEGKSTISVNLAQLMAQQGSSTLLVDADLRNPGLSRLLAEKPQSGFVEAFRDPSKLEASIMRDTAEDLSVLPVVLRQRIFHSSDMLASARMETLLNDFRSHYDYVILDLPPLGPVVDAKAIASRVDAFLFVVHWGRTSRQLARSVLASNPAIRNKCIGVILNRSDEKKLKLYRTYGSSEFYHQEYSQYFGR